MINYNINIYFLNQICLIKYAMNIKTGIAEHGFFFFLINLLVHNFNFLIPKKFN